MSNRTSEEALTNYPNLQAILTGTIAGNFMDWPAVRVELIAFRWEKDQLNRKLWLDRAKMTETIIEKDREIERLRGIRFWVGKNKPYKSWNDLEGEVANKDSLLRQVVGALEKCDYFNNHCLQKHDATYHGAELTKVGGPTHKVLSLPALQPYREKP